jgi:hypothetical protein
MKREAFGVVALSAEAGPIVVVCRHSKMFASNNFRKSLHRLIGIHLAILIHEQPVAY